MRALDLDFRRDGSKAKWPGGLLLAASLAAGLFLFNEYRQIEAEAGAAEASLRAAGPAARKKPAPPRAGADLQKTALEVKRASEILARLKLPWNELFVSVESANVPDVALLGVESDTEKRRVKISAEAKDLQAMLDYLRFLHTQPTLTEIYLQSHQYQQQDPQHPVRFVLSADWTARQ
jgi:hypothetical protein